MSDSKHGVTEVTADRTHRTIGTRTRSFEAVRVGIVLSVGLDKTDIFVIKIVTGAAGQTLYRCTPEGGAEAQCQNLAQSSGK